METWEAELLLWGLSVDALFALPLSFPPNLNWQSCRSQCTHSPVSPEAPPDVFSSHLSFLEMLWRQQLCPNLHWWHHTTTTRSFSPAWGHPTPLLQFYTFSVMDNDVVALFSRSHISCSFSCISFMCWLASHIDLLVTLEHLMAELAKLHWIEFPFELTTSSSGTDYSKCILQYNRHFLQQRIWPVIVGKAQLTNDGSVLFPESHVSNSEPACTFFFTRLPWHVKLFFVNCKRLLLCQPSWVWIFTF